jgi:hypothetical protein
MKLLYSSDLMEEIMFPYSNYKDGPLNLLFLFYKIIYLGFGSEVLGYSEWWIYEYQL